MSNSDTGIEIWRYELRAGGPLNRRSGRRTVQGFLLRERGGHGCVQPWPEFGHAPVEEQLAALTSGQSTPLIDAARRCAAVDRKSREAGRNLFDDLQVPRSHATITDPDAQAATAWQAGFRIFKLKCEASTRLRVQLAEIVASFPSVKLRLDFNEVPDAESFEDWWKKLDEAVQNQIDFLEDPFPFDEGEWNRFSERHHVRLAADRRQTIALIDGCTAIRVVKPAWGEEPFPDNRRASGKVVVTTAMDHPLGQTWAAWIAAKTAKHHPNRIETCGLQTHHLFDPDPFTEQLGPWTPRFHPPPGPGLGFDHLLSHLPWQKI